MRRARCNWSLVAVAMNHTFKRVAAERIDLLTVPCAPATLGITANIHHEGVAEHAPSPLQQEPCHRSHESHSQAGCSCRIYTSDAADEEP
jgi:hypothetical protein